MLHFEVGVMSLLMVLSACVCVFAVCGGAGGGTTDGKVVGHE